MRTWHLERDDTDRRQAAAARTAPDGVQHHAWLDLPVRRQRSRRHDLRAREFWEYIPNATARPRRRLHRGDGVELQVGQLRRRRLLRADRRAVHRQVQVVQRRRAQPGRAATCPPASRTTTPVRATWRATRPSSARRCSAMRARRSATARAAIARTASAATPTATAPASSATWPAKRGHLLAGRRTGIEDPPTCASDDHQPRACDGTGTCAPGQAGDREAMHRGRASAPARSVSTASVATPTARTRATRATRRAPRELLGDPRRHSRTTAPPRPATAR